MTTYRTQWHAPIDRSDIASRSDPRDDLREVGRIHIVAGHINIDWTLRPDRRDVRRWYAVDLSGIVRAHAAAPTILRDIAAHQPRPIGRRHW